MRGGAHVYVHAHTFSHVNMHMHVNTYVCEYVYIHEYSYVYEYVCSACACLVLCNCKHAYDLRFERSPPPNPPTLPRTPPQSPCHDMKVEEARGWNRASTGSIGDVGHRDSPLS